jgi:predicted ribosomally synthesized peptide with SipW-like signal peptide
MDDIMIELERDRPGDEQQRERRRRIMAAGTLAGLAFVGIGVSSALFTDSEALPGNDLTTGTVRLGATPGSAAISAGNMAPGDDEYGNVRVENIGSLQARYSVEASADDPDTKALRTQLRISAYSGVSPLNCQAGNVAGGTLEGGPTDLSTAFDLVGDVTPGDQAGDRTLVAAGSENLCFRVSLPLSTGNAYQDATSTVTLTFNAEQTAHNP